MNTQKPFPYERVALVDDVITTGSTLAEITKQLRKLGVKEITSMGLSASLNSGKDRIYLISIKIGINVEKITV